MGDMDNKKGPPVGDPFCGTAGLIWCTPESLTACSAFRAFR